MKVTLPIPPSVNAMYRRTHASFGMYKTAEAKAWIKECATILRKNRSKIIKGKVDVDAHFFFERESDLDNRLKALLDLLQECLVIQNDKQVYSILATKDFDKKNPRVEVVLRENE